MRLVLGAESAPCTPTAMTFEIPDPRLSLSPSPDHRMCSQSQDTLAFELSSAFARKTSGALSSASSTSSLVDQEIMVPSSPPPKGHGTTHPPQNPVVWKSSHGPPKNTFHGPPKLNLYSPIASTSPRSTGGIPPVRPPRPPPLNLYPTTAKRPVNTGSPLRFMGNRAITFALPPNPRAIKVVELALTTSGSSSDSPGDREECASQSSEDTARCACAAVSSDGHHTYHRGALRDRHVTANLPHLYRHVPLPTSSRTAQVLDLSDTPAPQRMYQSGLHTSSTPHLPSLDKQDVPPLPPLPSNGQADDVSSFPLSLFPPPPQSPLFIRRKINKNLALRPSPTTPGAPLPSSSSPDYTPLVTPTSPRLQTPPNHSKSCSTLPRYPSPRPVPPPLFDPPSTPLPTPPTTPALVAVRGGSSSSLSSKSLRSVRSINQLCSEQLLPPLLPPTHRATSSEPLGLQEGTDAVNQKRRRAQFRPEATHQVHPIVSRLEKKTR
jgi:hypothetical protein